MMALLTLNSVTKSYGALKVTDDITLSVDQGQTLGILGPNGAGKTTLFNLISGDVRSDRGQMYFEGQDIARLKAHQRCRAGIGRSYQVPQPFGNMTVFENLVTAACFGGGQTEREAWETAHEVLQQTGLLIHANKPAGSLTLLNRKRLELARALATRPKLLLLDEIAGGLTEHEAHELVEELQRIKAQGMTMIWIEHVVHALLSIADRLFVINFGCKLAEGEPRAVMDNPEVRRVYMGMEA
jgi:branched-chain amino acid transport system ATP-binding protein